MGWSKGSKRRKAEKLLRYQTRRSCSKGGTQQNVIEFPFQQIAVPCREQDISMMLRFKRPREALARNGNRPTVGIDLIFWVHENMPSDMQSQMTVKIESQKIMYLSSYINDGSSMISLCLSREPNIQSIHGQHEKSSDNRRINTLIVIENSVLYVCRRQYFPRHCADCGGPIIPSYSLVLVGPFLWLAFVIPPFET